MELYIVLLFLINIAKPLLYKVSAMRLNHVTLPICISFYATLLSLFALQFEYFHGLFEVGVNILIGNLFLLALALL